MRPSSFLVYFSPEISVRAKAKADNLNADFSEQAGRSNLSSFLSQCCPKSYNVKDWDLSVDSRERKKEANKNRIKMKISKENRMKKMIDR